MLNCLPSLVLLMVNPPLSFLVIGVSGGGRPLSPYLFVIVANILSILLKEKARLNLITPFTFRGGFKIFHLLYADDLVVYFRANHKSCCNVLDCLHLFHQLTGLKMNLSETRFYFPKRCSYRAKRSIHTQFQVLPFIYLGAFIAPRPLPSSAQRSYFSSLNALLGSWQSKLISQAGRITLHCKRSSRQ